MQQFLLCSKSVLKSSDTQSVQNGNGRLRIVNVGGMNANNAEAENCRVVTKFDGIYEGTLQLCNASSHVNSDYNSTSRKFDVMEVVLDEIVESAAKIISGGINRAFGLYA